ncbi:MAG TPA: tetraacyldisaccharide 4'-kinase [Elusimicrobiota bacterium]|nr:tetraacyldisaccharide 4'-kinase [Elusimicrobiota bacterium]
MSGWSKRRAKLKSHLPGQALLGAASLAYGAGVLGRRALYELKILKRRRIGAKVICIGNLTTGGTGKTPAVLLAAETLRKRGHDVAILSRGYGGTASKKEVTVLLDGRQTDWRLCGDEPWMVHQSLQGQGVPVLVCPDRTKAGELAVEMYGSSVVILDDGFQHLKLHRDLDVVLVNATDPFGGGRLLPLGNLREPVSALRRAHIVIVTHADRVTAAELAALRDRIDAAHPGVKILESAHKADHVLDVRTEEKHPLEHLKGKAVVALSGIGDPLSFENQLESLGATIAQSWRYPDHHAYAEKELRAISELRGALPVVTTYKDFIRLPERWRETLTGEVLVLGIKLEILKGRNTWIDMLSELADKARKRRS